MLASDSTLDDSGSIPQSPPPSDSLCPTVGISSKILFSAHSGLDTRKAYEPHGISPVAKNCDFVLTPCLGQIFQLCHPTSSLSAESLLQSNLWQRRVTTPNPPSIA